MDLLTSATGTSLVDPLVDVAEEQRRHDVRRPRGRARAAVA
jgi:hypothetical protein